MKNPHKIHTVNFPYANFGTEVATNIIRRNDNAGKNEEGPI